MSTLSRGRDSQLTLILYQRFFRYKYSCLTPLWRSREIKRWLENMSSKKKKNTLNVIPRGTVIMYVFLCSFNDTVTKNIFQLNSTMKALEQRWIVLTWSAIHRSSYSMHSGEGGGEWRDIYPEIIRLRGDANHSTNPTPIWTGNESVPPYPHTDFRRSS